MAPPGVDEDGAARELRFERVEERLHVRLVAGAQTRRACLAGLPHHDENGYFARQSTMRFAGMQRRCSIPNGNGGSA